MTDNSITKKHTPGPWRLSPHYKCGWSGASKEPTPNRWKGIYEPITGQALGSRSTIISVGMKGAEVDDYWLNIKEADARLIAAAPDLFDALRHLFAVMSGHEDTPEEILALSAAENAIAKAEGRSDDL